MNGKVLSVRDKRKVTESAFLPQPSKSIQKIRVVIRVTQPFLESDRRSRLFPLGRYRDGI